MKSRLLDPAWGRSVLPILLGLAAAQVIGTLFVRQSNLHLFNMTQALAQAGWWVIPTGPARATLMEWKTTFLGGIFFTLSAGAALTLATLALLRGSEQLGRRGRSLLLSNSAGRTVNDFYYRYALYAAEPFKSFEQKSIWTCRLAEIGDDRLRRRLEILLGARDVLHAPGFEPVDLTVRQPGAKLLLAGIRGKQLETEQSLFLADPNPWLLQFSALTDRHAPFRRLTVPSLLLGFPILFYLSCYGFVRLLAGLFLNHTQATPASSGICLLVGILLFIPVARSGPVAITESDIGPALESGEWHRRVAALRHIEKHRIEIARFPRYRRLLLSPMAAERYWLARALGTSRHSATYSDLLRLLQDQNPIVICQTYYALGQRSNPAAIGLIKDKMIASDHWYTQLYGYQAIKNLGWRQTR